MAAQDLCALSDVRTALEIPVADTSRDSLFSTLITQASVAIMLETEREFAPASTALTRRFQARRRWLDLSPYDLRTCTSIVLDPEGSSPSTLTATVDYQLELVTSQDDTNTYQSIQFSDYLTTIGVSTTGFAFGYADVDITGDWGCSSVPLPVQRACVVTVASWARKDVSGLLASAELEMGGTTRPAYPQTMEIPNAAKKLMERYYRHNAYLV